MHKRKYVPPTQHLYEKGLACTHVDCCHKCAMGFHTLHTRVQELEAQLAALTQGGSRGN